MNDLQPRRAEETQSNRSLVLAIDPGITGAIAIYSPKTKILYELFDMPVIEDKFDGTKTLDHYGLARIVDEFAKSVRLAVVECVHSMPGQGVSSTFLFGRTTGLCIGVLAAHLLPILQPQPSVWKASMGLTRDKNRSLEKARQLFPDRQDYFKLKKHHDRAEAALLAVYGGQLS